MKNASFCRQGKDRQTNEDALLCLPGKGLFLVCDGVGGGADSAKDVVDSFRDLYENASEGELDRGKALLEEAFKRANTKLLQRSVDEGASRCAAAVATIVRRGSFTVGWCGDCRAYRSSGRKLEQLSKDHTRLQELVDRGVVTEADVDEELRKSALTKCLGAREETSVEFIEEQPVLAGSRLFLCTDGVSDILTEDALASVLKLDDVSSVTSDLKKKITDGADDAAAIIVSFDKQDTDPKIVRSVVEEGFDAVQKDAGDLLGTSLNKDNLPVRRQSTSIVSFVRSLPSKPRKELILEVALLSGVTGFCLRIPQILELVGQRLAEVGLGYWAVLAIVVYLLILRIRLR